MPPRGRHVRFQEARLAVPALTEGTVDRGRVTRLLDAAVRRCRVTVVTGAAGSGKTHAVALWSRSAGAARTVHVAWMTLDRADADLHRFWSGAVGALRRAVDDPRLTALVVPPRPTPLFVDRVVAALAELDAGVVLVVDDAHEIADTPAGEALAALVRALPEHHRLVLVARQRPPVRLSRLRLSGDLGEIGATDLAFTTTEAPDLLRASGVRLSEGSLTAVMRVTEGWAAGLRLAALAMATSSDPEVTAHDLGGGHSLVTDYLVDEVITGLGVQRFDLLLRASVVERVCPSLAEALTGDPEAGEVLASLASGDVLVSALDDTGWYRYHPMLQEMLRARLRSAHPQLAAQLHGRAQRWFEQAGEPLEALRHAVLAGEREAAVRLALRSTWMLTFTPERRALAAVLAPLGGSGVRGAEEAVVAALAAHGVDDDEVTVEWLRRAEPGLASLPEPHRSWASGVHRLLLSDQARRRGDPQHTAAAAGEALELTRHLLTVPGEDAAALHGVASSLLGAAELWQGRPEQAEEQLRHAILGFHQRDAGLAVQVWHGGLLALSEAARGRVGPAQDRARLVLGAASRHGWHDAPETSPAWATLAVAALVRAEVDEADRHLASARQALAGAHDPAVRGVVEALGVWAALGRDDLARARRALADLRAWAQRHPELVLVAAHAHVLDAELQLAAGQGRAASLALVEREAGAGHLDGQPGPPAVAVTRGHVLLAVGEPERALAAVSPLLETGGVAAAAAWVVAALAHDRLRRDASAAEALTWALALAEPHGAVLPFLRPGDRLPALLRRHVETLGAHRAMAERVLARTVGTADGSRAVIVELPRRAVLTERERSVLAYLPTLSTNSEIAEHLHISVNTVKQHLKAIHRKLGVSTRRDAVRVARRLDLLEGEEAAPSLRAR